MALVLVAGILALFALLVAAQASGARFAATAAAGSGAAREADLASASALDYAAARLAEDPFPRRVPSARNRCDDWTHRKGSGVGVEGPENPSYSHGEPWSDANGNGRHDPGESPLADLDGDGRFSAWSGRLRASGARFSLRIECAEGKIPLAFPSDAEGGRYWRNAVVHALNNLGAIRLAPRGNFRRDERRGNHDFRLSRLGDDLMAHAPAGGYASPEKVRAALDGLGYLPGEIDAVLPFLDAGPFDPQDESARVPDTHRGTRSWSAPGHVPVNLTVAPAEVLEALWRYLSFKLDQHDLEPGAPWNVVCPWTDGLRYDQLFLGTVLFPEEAARLAGLTVTLRGQAPLSWTRLRAAIVDTASALFAEDHAALAPIPLLQGSWTLAKADLAFRGVAGDLFSAPTGPAPAAWGTGGILPRPFCRSMQVTRVDPPDLWNRYNDAHHPFRRFDAGTNNNRTKIIPVGGTLAPPGRFDVASLGSAGPSRASAGGRLFVSEQLAFTSQEDFENLSGGFHLARRGIRPAPESRAVWEARRGFGEPDLAGGEPAVFYDDGAVLRRTSRVVSLPRDNIRAYTSLTWGDNYWGYPRAWGALALASREWGLGPVPDAQLYWAVRDDFDHVRNNQGSNDPRTDPFWEADLWHERPAGFAVWEPAGSLLPETVLATAYGTPQSYLNPFPVPGLIPGRDGTNGDPAAGFSVEARVGPGSSIVLSGTQEIRMDVWPAVGGDGRRLLVFELQFDTGGSCAASVADADQAAGTPSLRHVVITAEHVPPNMHIALHVDGTVAPLDGQAFHRHGHPFLVGALTRMTILRLDEIRFYDRKLQSDEAKTLASLDRFARKGTYVSPLYAFDAPARMDRACWTGAWPAGFPPSCLSAVVEGYADEAGTAPLFRAPLLIEGAIERLPAAPVRSFRYFVLFDVPEADVPPPLADSPVFESIWFTFRRNAHAPRWW